MYTHTHTDVNTQTDCMVCTQRSSARPYEYHSNLYIVLIHPANRYYAPHTFIIVIRSIVFKLNQQLYHTIETNFKIILFSVLLLYVYMRFVDRNGFLQYNQFFVA